MSKQLHLVLDASRRAGGEGLAATRYGQALAKQGEIISLASLNPLDPYDLEKSNAVSLNFRAVSLTGKWEISLRDAFRFINLQYDTFNPSIVHLHGVWSPYLAIGGIIALRNKIPLVISPHGCLEPWALNYKAFKKNLALKTYQGYLLNKASLLVATSKTEGANLRNLNLMNPIATIPNGVDVGPIKKISERDNLKKILFLSRVHPKKGLLDLVEAWSQIRRPGWKIIIAGADEEGYQQKVEDLINQKGLKSDFEFRGFVEGERKQACYDEANIFILPTYSENFGIAVAEALANQIPVITTKGAPWEDLIAHRCGWWVEPGVEGIRVALSDALNRDANELREMGANGRRLVIEKYSWDGIGKMAAEASEWILSKQIKELPFISIHRKDL